MLAAIAGLLGMGFLYGGWAFLLCLAVAACAVGAGHGLAELDP